MAIDNSELPGRRSIRLPGFDYTQPGAYFITITTKNGEHHFGYITNETVSLSCAGVIADECWREIPDHFPNAELGAYVIMPNHIHGIIILHERTGTNYRTGTIYRARTPSIEQFQKPVVGSIPTIIRSYKAGVTRRIGQQSDISDIWHRNYYEHVIRNHDDYDRIQRYIEANPINWLKDEEDHRDPT